MQGPDQEKPCSCLGLRPGPTEADWVSGDSASRGAGEQGRCRAHPVQGVGRTDSLLSPSGDTRGASGSLGPMAMP